MKQRRRKSVGFWWMGLISLLCMVLVVVGSAFVTNAKEPDPLEDPLRLSVQMDAQGEWDHFAHIKVSLNGYAEQDTTIKLVLYVLNHEQMGGNWYGDNQKIGNGRFTKYNKELLLETGAVARQEIFVVPMEMDISELELLVYVNDTVIDKQTKQCILTQGTSFGTKDDGNQQGQNTTTNGAQVETRDSVRLAYEQIGARVNWFGEVKVPNLRSYMLILIIYIFLIIPGGYGLMAYFRKLDYFKISVIVCSVLLALVIFLMSQTTRFDDTFYYYTRVVSMDQMSDEQCERVYVKLQSPYNGSYTACYPADYTAYLCETSYEKDRIYGHFSYQRESLEKIDEAELAYELYENEMQNETKLTYDNVRSFEEKRLILEKTDGIEAPIMVQQNQLTNTAKQVLYDCILLRKDGYQYLAKELLEGATIDIGDDSFEAYEYNKIALANATIRNADDSRNQRQETFEAILEELWPTLEEDAVYCIAYAKNDVNLIKDATGCGYTMYLLRLQ